MCILCVHTLCVPLVGIINAFLIFQKKILYFSLVFFDDIVKELVNRLWLGLNCSI